MNKIPLILASAFATVASTHAATLAYTFETPGNITGSGTSLAYSGPDSNDFGDGITVSSFTMTDRDAGEYSRFVNLGGGSVEAAVGGAGQTLSFTITIDDTVSVDLTNILFDTSARWTQAGSIDDVFVGLVVNVGGIDVDTSSHDWVHDGNPNYQSVETAGEGNTAAGVDHDLSALTNLTDTTVTFNWALSGDRNNTFARIAYGLDDITLNGTVTAVPEPSSTALLGLGGLTLILRRRRA